MPPLLNSIAGSVVLFLSTTLASAAGIGGGGLTLPVLIIIFGFNFNKSVVLSLCSVLGNTLLQVLVNFPLRHPQEISRQLIYWDAILILLPAQLGGSSVGVIVSTLTPETVKVLLAILILCFAVYKTYLKGMTRWEKEKEENSNSSKDMKSKDFPNPELQQLLLDSSRDQLGDSVVSSRKHHHTILSREGGPGRARGNSYLSGGSDGRDRAVSVFSDRDEYDITAEQSCDRAISAFVEEIPLLLPKTTFAALAGLWMTNASLLLSMQLFDQCDWQRLLLLSSTFPLLLGFIVMGVKYVSRIQTEKPHTVLDSDLNWNEVSGIPAACTFVIGIICSLLGIGGGELMGPLLLQMGLLPQVVSVTTSVLSFFVSSSSLMLYGIKGRFPPIVECLWIFSIALSGGFAGRKLAVVITWYYNRPSITIFALVVVLICALGLLVFDVVKEEPDWSQSSFCEDD